MLRRVGDKLSRGFLFCLAGVIAFGYLADEMGEGDTARFDSFIREGVNSFATPVLTPVIAIFFSFVGDWPFFTILGFAIFAFLLYIKWKREAVIFLDHEHRRADPELFSLKALIYQRQRPDPFFGYEYCSPRFLQLPERACPRLVLLLRDTRLAPRCECGNDAKQTVAIYLSAALLILIIGLSRIYLGVHYPSDIVAGYLVATVWTLTVIFADRSLT